MTLLALQAHTRRDKGCPDRTGGDGVDANALFDELVGEGAREGNDSPFARRIVEAARDANIRVDGGAVDDDAVRCQVFQDLLREIEIRVDVGLERGRPLLAGSNPVSSASF